jgi:predicted RNA-binding protein with PUA-like domain
MSKRAKRYWLMKSEPDVYSIEDLEREGQACWDGVRNYQARNFMRDGMEVGDLVLYYHSNANPPGVAGVAKVCAEAYPDHTQFDPKSDYYDPKSKKDDPRWWMVDVCFVEKFPEVMPLPVLKNESALEGMPLLRKGQRLSVQPVDRSHFKHILKMAGAKTKLR